MGTPGVACLDRILAAVICCAWTCRTDKDRCASVAVVVSTSKVRSASISVIFTIVQRPCNCGVVGFVIACRSWAIVGLIVVVIGVVIGADIIACVVGVHHGRAVISDILIYVVGFVDVPGM